MFSSLLKKHTPYKQISHFRSKRILETKYGIETPYLGPKLWNLVPNEYKFIASIADFKAKIKTWVPENCPCKLHKIYIHQIGFIKNILGFTNFLFFFGWG